jgi:hypothetical protein
MQYALGTDPQPFRRANQTAWRFVAKATDDYLLARFGMFPLLTSAFVLATQAVEKYLKGYLLFQDKKLNGSPENVRRAVTQKAKEMGRNQERGHDIEAAVALATDIGFPCSPVLNERIRRLNQFFAMRYPYGGPTSYGGMDVHEFDATVFGIWEGFKSIDANYYHEAGPFAPVYSLRFAEYHNQANDHVRSHFEILTRQNLTYASRNVQIESGIRDLLVRRFPRR